jgi:hypothetical protein
MAMDVAVEPVLEVLRLIRLPSSSNVDVLPQVWWITVVTDKPSTNSRRWRLL